MMQEGRRSCLRVVAKFTTIIGEVFDRRRRPSGLTGGTITGEAIDPITKLEGSDLDRCINWRIERVIR
jgi:hypothetical protein